MAKKVYFDSLQGPIPVQILYREQIISGPWAGSDRVVVTALKDFPGYPKGTEVLTHNSSLWDSVKRTGICQHTFAGKTWLDADVPVRKFEPVPYKDGFQIVPVKGGQDAE